VELGHWLINKRGPEAVRYGREPSESPAVRVEHEIGASGKRPIIPEVKRGRGSIFTQGGKELQYR